MSDSSSRREFLTKLSLTGAAVVAGGGLLSTTGCEKKVYVYIPQVSVDPDGSLRILDRNIVEKLQANYDDQETQQHKPNWPDGDTTHPRLGIRVKWVKPDSTDNKVNSLCSC